MGDIFEWENQEENEVFSENNFKKQKNIENIENYQQNLQDIVKENNNAFEAYRMEIDQQRENKLKEIKTKYEELEFQLEILQNECNIDNLNEFEGFDISQKKQDIIQQYEDETQIILQNEEVKFKQDLLKLQAIWEKEYQVNKLSEEEQVYIKQEIQKEYDVKLKIEKQQLMSQFNQEKQNIIEEIQQEQQYKINQQRLGNEQKEQSQLQKQLQNLKSQNEQQKIAFKQRQEQVEMENAKNLQQIENEIRNEFSEQINQLKNEKANKIHQLMNEVPNVQENMNIEEIERLVKEQVLGSRENIRQLKSNLNGKKYQFATYQSQFKQSTSTPFDKFDNSIQELKMPGNQYERSINQFSIQDPDLQKQRENLLNDMKRFQENPQVNQNILNLIQEKLIEIEGKLNYY